MSELIYHVFFEDHQEGVGLYIGSYKEKERADKITQEGRACAGAKTGSEARLHPAQEGVRVVG